MDQYAVWPFSTDPEFQQGLREILSRNTDLDPAEAELRARVFYFNHLTGHSIDVEQAREYEAAQKPKEPQIMTFSQIQELIESGKVDDIPNNKVISGELNTERPTESQAVPRKKPWELAQAPVDS